MTNPVTASEVMDIIDGILSDATDELQRVAPPAALTNTDAGQAYQEAIRTVADALELAVKYARDQMERGEA